MTCWDQNRHWLEPMPLSAGDKRDQVHPSITGGFLSTQQVVGTVTALHLARVDSSSLLLRANRRKRGITIHQQCRCFDKVQILSQRSGNDRLISHITASREAAITVSHQEDTAHLSRVADLTHTISKVCPISPERSRQTWCSWVS